MTRPSPSDPPAQRIRLRHAFATYCDEGSGPPIVAVHGLPGSHRDFRYLAPAVTTFARFVRVDLPGFGGTPVAAGVDASPSGRAAFVKEVVDHLALVDPIILGHSMGGLVATAACAQWPNRFSGLVLLASPGVRPHRMFARLNAGRIDAALRFPLTRPLLLPLLRRAFDRAGFRGQNDTAIVRTIRCAAATSFPEHAERVARLDLPTMLAHCDDDAMIEAELMEELGRLCPSGPRLRFEIGGHNLQKTRAREIARALSSWFITLASR